MRAVVVEHRGEAGAIREIPTPAPGEREVLVRVSAAGVNPMDWKVRDLYDHPLPLILGQDFAGSVVGIGHHVQKYAEGERVFGIAREHGAYADFTIVPESDTKQPVAHIPDDVGDADAAGLPTPGLTALACIERLRVGAGQVVLIVGVTGAVGQFAAQLARDRGARIAGIGKAENERIARSLDLDGYAAYDRDDVVDVMRARYPEGVDVAIDLADDGDGVKRIAEVIRSGGAIASTIGAVDEKYFSHRDVKGINVNLMESPQSSHEGLRRLAEMVEQGRLRVPIVAERNLVDAVQALDLLKSGRISGKIILTT